MPFDIDDAVELMTHRKVLDAISFATDSIRSCDRALKHQLKFSIRKPVWSSGWFNFILNWLD